MSGGPSRSGVGGSANELGSLHRSGVAAVLAVHGLSDTPLDGMPGKVPAALALETRDAVDDIVATMQDGTRWFIQAKRSASGKQLQSALRQWASQTINQGDLLIIAVRRATGMLRSAGEALDLRRTDPDAPLTMAQTEHLAEFRRRLALEAGANVDNLLAAARVISWEVDFISDSGSNAGSARLEGGVVAPADGPAAFTSLQAYFRTAAARRVATSPSDWVAAIRASTIRVIAHLGGTPGAVAAAQADALTDYLQTIATGRDRLSIHSICPDVPVLEVPDFLDAIELTYRPSDSDRDTSTDVISAIRRNPRFVIRGLPGAGKSEVMRQAAAWLAGDAGAPVPILVRLGELAGKVAADTDLTMDTVVSIAAAAQGRNSAELRQALSQAIASGHCVLLLDALDEAFDKRGMLVEGFSRLLSDAHPDLGVILTTRASAEDVVGRLTFPVTELAPMKGSRVQIALLERFAADHPAEWLVERTAILTEQEESHGDLWSVPLLATLATVRVARDKAAATSAAELLHGVIQDSIDAWDARRRRGDSRLPPANFDSEMLLYGFAGIGRLLNTRSGVTVRQAKAAVEMALVPWHLSPPAQSRIAAYIVDFWDTTVGVFVDTGDHVEARSRQFAELGDVIYAMVVDGEVQRRAWLEQSLDSPGQINAVALATAEDPDAARWLIDRARTDPDPLRRARAMSWVSEFVSSWTHRHLDGVIDALLAAVHDALPYVPPDEGKPGLQARLRAVISEKDALDGHGWRFAVVLATLKTTPKSVDSALAVLPFDGYRADVLRALAALARSETDAVPTAETLELIEAALRAPLPPDDTTPTHIDDYGVLVIGASSEPLLFGLDRLGVAASTHARLLSAGAVDVLWRLANRAPVRMYDQLRHRLRAAGFEDPAPLLRIKGLDPGLAAEMPGLLEARWLLGPVSERFPGDGTESPNDAWRLASLGQVFDLMRINTASIPDLREAPHVSRALVGDLVEASVVAGNVDGAVAGMQARDVLASDDLVDRVRLLRAHVFVLPACDGRKVPDSLRPSLIRVVADARQWMSFTAFHLMYNQENPAIADAARDATSTRWSNQRHLAWLRLTNTPDTEAEVALMLNESSAYRAAAAYCCRDEDEQWRQDVARRLLEDEDGTVRSEAGATLEQVEKASYWTCKFCGTQVPTGNYKCPHCQQGSTGSIPVHSQLRAKGTRPRA